MRSESPGGCLCKARAAYANSHLAVDWRPFLSRRAPRQTGFDPRGQRVSWGREGGAVLQEVDLGTVR